MQIVQVNLLKTETSCATRVSITGRKRAMYLDISAVPPLEAADNFLMHLRDSPAGPDDAAREHIHRTIPKAASGSAWIPPQVSDDEFQVCSIFEWESWQSAIRLRTLLLCRLMRLRRLDRSSRRCTTRRTQRCSPWIIREDGNTSDNEPAEASAGSVRASSPTTGRSRHVETKDQHHENPRQSLCLQEAAVDPLALASRSGKRHPSLSKYASLTNK